MLAFTAGQAHSVTYQLDSERFERCDREVEWKISYQTVSATDLFCVCVCVLSYDSVLCLDCSIFNFWGKSIQINCVH